MKLLTKPGTATETVTIGGTTTETVTRVNILGLLGGGPLFVRKEVVRHSPSYSFAGRTTVSPVVIDFENSEIPVVEPPSSWSSEYRNTVDYDLDFDGVVYRLINVIPIESLDQNIWRCSIDRFEINP
jgi:hypothetical protein